jgi:hypothetical protein
LHIPREFDLANNYWIFLQNIPGWIFFLENTPSTTSLFVPCWIYLLFCTKDIQADAYHQRWRTRYSVLVAVICCLRKFRCIWTSFEKFRHGIYRCFNNSQC